MIFSDDGQHNKPHFHVYYAEYDASVGIDGELLVGKLPVKQLKLVQAWAAIHEDELYCAWNKAVRNEPFGKIEPLRLGVDCMYIDYGVPVWNDGDIDIAPEKVYRDGIPCDNQKGA